VNLNHALSFADHPTQTALRVLGLDSDRNDPDLETNKYHQYCFNVSPKRDSIKKSRQIKIVLVWTDPPSSPVSFVNLINDLNLEVLVNDDVIKLGNAVYHGAWNEQGFAVLHLTLILYLILTLVF
jgi:hypothetical protein